MLRVGMQQANTLCEAAALLTSTYLDHLQALCCFSILRATMLLPHEQRGRGRFGWRSRVQEWLQYHRRCQVQLLHCGLGPLVRFATQGYTRTASRTPVE